MSNKPENTQTEPTAPAKAGQYGNIFLENAPAYFARNIPVIPLKPASKRPRPLNWSNFATTEIPEGTKNTWLAECPTDNMGLVLGSMSGVSVLDVDTDDESIIRAIMRVVPYSPWKRVGRKGFVLAFRYTGAKTFRISTRALGSICEFLSEGTQVVLPPSIHPDTLKPYVANCDLLSVIDNLQPVGEDFEEKLRKALTDVGLDLSNKGYGKMTDYIPAGFRDSAITSKAGVFAYDVRKGLITLKEAIRLLYAVEEGFVQQVAGDAMDMDKHVGNLINFLRHDLENPNHVLPKGWDDGLTPEELKAFGLDQLEDKVEWSYDQIQRQVAEKQEADVSPVDTVLEMVKKMSQVIAPNAILERATIRTMAKQSGGMLTAGDITQELTRIRTEAKTSHMVLPGVELTSHSAVALAVLTKMSEFNSMAVDEANTLYRFMGSHWVEVSLEDLKLYISTNFKNLDIVRRNSDVKGIAELVHVHADRGLNTSDINGVNFANGFLSEEGVLLPHTKEYGATYVLPYPYRPDLCGKMPRFIKFLDDCWGHTPDYAHRVKALQQAICCTLLGFAPRFQRAFLAYGVARSGKSVLLEVISNLMPEEAKSALSPQQWKDNFQVVGLNNKLLNVVGELSERHSIDGHTFKEVIDGSAMSVRKLYGAPFIMHCKAAQWAGSNHFPRTTDSSEGFNRRWLVFHFDRAVPMEKVKVNLARQLVAEEREAIVAWALDSLKELSTASGLHLPPSHHEIVNQISCFNNPVRYFLQECKQLRFVTDGTTNEANLYSTFIRFSAQFMGLRRPMDGRDFRQKMDELSGEFKFTRFIDVYRGLAIPEGLN